MPINRNGDIYYKTSEAKDILKESLIKDAEKLAKDLNKIKSNKNKLCIK